MGVTSASLPSALLVHEAEGVQQLVGDVPVAAVEAAREARAVQVEQLPAAPLPAHRAAAAPRPRAVLDPQEMLVAWADM